jgi:hypothetical protein
LKESRFTTEGTESTERKTERSRFFTAEHAKDAEKRQFTTENTEGTERRESDF